MIEVNATTNGMIAMAWVLSIVLGGCAGFGLRGWLMASKAGVDEKLDITMCMRRCKERLLPKELIGERRMAIIRKELVKNADVVLSLDGAGNLIGTEGLTPHQRLTLKKLYPEYLKQCEKEKDLRVEAEENPENENRKRVKIAPIDDRTDCICGICTKFNICGEYKRLRLGEKIIECHGFDDVRGTTTQDTLTEPHKEDEEPELKEGSICHDCDKSPCTRSDCHTITECEDFEPNDTPSLCPRCIRAEGCVAAIKGDKMYECETFEGEEP